MWSFFYEEPMTGLKKNSDFAKVYRQGRSRADRSLPESRIGISVSKKTGNSVVRHRIKRRLKEIYRLNEPSFGIGKDFVVIARPSAAAADYHELEQ